MNEVDRSTAHLTRNSSLELLRIFAMFLICCNHFMQEMIGVAGLPLVQNIILCFLSRLGGVGDCLFFGITAWFVSTGRPFGLRSAAKKVWRLWGQLLYYSVLLMPLCLAMGDYKTAIECLLPVPFGLWWYPTAYALFILVAPFLVPVLRLLGGHP